MTFDQCTWLNRKHTIFGKVVGDTMFNLLAMEHLDTDAEDRPLIPPKILGAKVLINPFDDIIQRNKPVSNVNEKETKISKTKDENNKGKVAKEKPTIVAKNISLLSFDHDGEEEEDEGEIGGKERKKPDVKIKSSHDALNDPKLSKQPVVSIEELE